MTRTSLLIGLLAVAVLFGVARTEGRTSSDASAIPRADRGTIAFMHKVWGKTAHAIYLMHADGSDRRLLTAGRAFEWSPDAMQIAFSHRSTAGFGNSLLGRLPRRQRLATACGELLARRLDMVAGRSNASPSSEDTGTRCPCRGRSTSWTPMEGTSRD